jgi:predicted nuclease with TOPRIM domain
LSDAADRLVISDLAAENAELRERAESYRAMVSVALEDLHALRSRTKRQEERLARLVDEVRRLREALFALDRSPEAAA